MTKKVVYQTLEDRGNPDVIENQGPFICNRSNAWLGEGYYFWDTFEENAHWWGKECNNFTRGYIICKAECDFNDTCFDLVGNTEHIQWFSDSVNFLKLKGIINDKTTVARVLQYFRTFNKTFIFDAIRAYGINSKSSRSEYSSNLFFNPNKPPYLDLKPAIQICFYKKNSLNLRNYRIIYPDHYIDGYLI